MSMFHRSIIRTLPQVKARPEKGLTIKLHADGHIISGLKVDDVLQGERDLTVFKKLQGSDKQGVIGNLTSVGGVHFVTKNNKRWFIRFGEFQFLFNHGPTVAKPTNPKEPEAVVLKEAA